MIVNSNGRSLKAEIEYNIMQIMDSHLNILIAYDEVKRYLNELVDDGKIIAWGVIIPNNVNYHAPRGAACKSHS